MFAITTSVAIVGYSVLRILGSVSIMTLEVVLFTGTSLSLALVGVLIGAALLFSIGFLIAGKIRHMYVLRNIRNAIKNDLQNINNQLMNWIKNGNFSQFPECWKEALTLRCAWDSIIINMRTGRFPINKSSEIYDIFRPFSELNMLTGFILTLKDSDISSPVEYFSDFQVAFQEEMKIFDAEGYNFFMCYDSMDNFLFTETRNLKEIIRKRSPSSGEENGKSKIKSTEEIINNPEINVELRKRTISEINFSGGGAKGIAYHEFMQSIDRGDFKDLLAKDYCVSGVSIGAAAAAFLSFEIFDFKEVILTFQKIFQGTCERSFPKLDYPRKYDRKGIYAVDGVIDYINTAFSERIGELLKGVSEDEINDTFELNSLESQRIILLKKKEDLHTPIVFRDIELLRKMKTSKEHVHRLCVSAVKFGRDECRLFSAEKSPDVPIALAVRMSMSIPLLFRCLVLDGDSYGDGGFVSNVIFGAFPNIPNENRLYVLFHDHGSRQNALCYSSSDFQEFPNMKSVKFLDYVGKLTGFSHSYYENCLEEWKKVRENSQNCLILPHGQLSLASFKFTPEDMNAALHQVQCCMKAWLIQHKGELYKKEELANTTNETEKD
ncbi:MAG: patatin-like phospholipase family protein [Puniceicoccales bacterium]|nr:patatin-like phospholipase family protein [Puniceicoccales bacterium]